ncbi:MAG: hypothetical protein AABZ06_01370 [Bdellovibrionota bacterium]
MKQYIFYLTLLLVTSIIHASEPKKSLYLRCTTSREFITTLEFLRNQDQLQIHEQQAQQIATKVTDGCTGAAQRFISVAMAMIQSGFTSPDAVKLGVEFSAKSDVETNTFLTIFKKAFLAEYLDLDIRSALKMARALSMEFTGNASEVFDDFDKLLEFCAGAKSLDLPRPECGTFAVRLARQGETWSGGIAKPFIEAFEFLRSESGPELITSDALKLAESLLAAGPDGPINFIQAYKYAASRKGLKMDRKSAIAFARQMAMPKTLNVN